MKTINFKKIFKMYGGILIGLMALIVIFSFLSPSFREFNNILNIILQVSIIAISAFGMTFALIIAGIDLSIGSIIALSGTTAALLLNLGLPFPIAIVLCLIMGIFLGFINGFLISKAEIPAFIVTVATMGIFRGVAYILTGGGPIQITNEKFLYLGNEKLFGIPFPIIILIVVFIIMNIVLGKTKFGRQSYIIGGNEEAALYSGINVKKVKIHIYMLIGFLASLSGIILASRLYSGQPNSANGYELDAIAAAVLGGTSLSGGYGTIAGTLIGAIIIGVINNGMNLLNITYFYQLIVKGLVIIMAVYFDVQSKKKKK